MPIKKNTATKKLKNTTNYSQAQITRDLKAKMDRKMWFATAAKKGKDASKKINATWSGNKKTKSKTINPRAKMNEVGKQTRSAAQNRAIHARKK